MREVFPCILLASVLLPQVPAPAAPVYALTGGRVFTLAGPPLENGTVLIREGRIAAVGTGVSLPRDAEVIDVRGLQVYPGLFDSISQLGLTEIGQVSATVDLSELGDYHPQLVAATAVHPASEHIPVARANGITHAGVAPGGGRSSSPLLPGQASLLLLDGWTVEEMLVKKSVGLVLHWPSLQTRSFDFSTFSTRERSFEEVRKEYEEKVSQLEDWLEAARHYAQAVERGSRERFERDLKLEALIPVIRGDLPLLVMANSARDIRNAVEFITRNRLKMILCGGGEAWKVKELLKEHDIPVILRPTQTLPEEEDDPYDRPFTQPGELRAAGIRIAFATFDSSDSRTLPYEAATAVPYGLPWEEALKAVTLYPAQILGVDDQLGTLEAGKMANLIVTDGDPLEIRTQVRYLFIHGRLVSTENRHQRLYQHYQSRPR